MKNSDSLGEWEKITRLYPALAKFAKRSLIQRFIINLILTPGAIQRKMKNLFLYQGQNKLKESM